MDTLNKNYDLEHLTDDIKNFNFITLPKTSEKQMISFILDLIKKYAVKQKNPILLLSFENDEKQFVMKLLFAHSKIEPDKLCDCEWIELCELASDLSNASIFLDHNPNITINNLSSEIRQFQQKKI